MTTGRNNWSRFRPRFSLRTLFVFVTLVCAYFGAWEATKKYGVPFGPEGPAPKRDIYSIVDSTSPVAFIVSRQEWCVDLDGTNESRQSIHRHYYLWLFGPMIRLPFEGTPDSVLSNSGGVF